MASRTRPPIVGVPCLDMWPAGPSSRICCPNSFAAQKRDEGGPGEDAEQHRRHAGGQHVLHAVTASTTASSPIERLRLHEHGVARADARRGQRPSSASSSVGVPARRRSARLSGPTATIRRSRGRRPRRPTSRGSARPPRPELGHVAEHGDGARGRPLPTRGRAAPRPSRPGSRCSSRRSRRRRPEAAGARRASARSRPRRALQQRHVDVDAQGVAGRDGSGEVHAVVALVEAHRHGQGSTAVDDLRPAGADPARRTSAPSASPKVTTRVAAGRYGSSSGSACGHDGRRRPARASRISAFAAATASTVPISSRCTGPTERDHADVGRGESGQVGDLPGAAHPELADDGLGVRARSGTA